MSSASPQEKQSSLLGCLAAAASRVCSGAKHESVQDSTATQPSASSSGQALPYSSMSLMSEPDLECINQRHFYRKPPAAGETEVFARQIVGAGRRCRHGWPQAIVYDPLYREKEGKSYRLGDTTRLTCPLLVTAIDKYEKGGAMQRYNEHLGPGEKWDGELAKVNEAHRLLRLKLIGDRPDELSEVKELIGENAFAIAMRSGLASLRPEAKPDVKCLHAQVADELCRDGNNVIAQQVLRDLEDQGVPTNGSDECCDNCNVDLPLEFARWKLDKCKNNVGRRLSRTRRKQDAASRAASLAGDICYEHDDDNL